MKAARLLKEQTKILTDVVLLVDEMYLQKCAQYAGGECVGADLDGNLYNPFFAINSRELKNLRFKLNVDTHSKMFLPNSHNLLSVQKVCGGGHRT